MALPSTVYKITLGLSDVDRGYYAEHALTLARHPSETEERLMVRIFAFLMYATPGLEPGRGLSCIEDPDWLERTLTGEIDLWLDVGLPDLKRVKRALAQAKRVAIVSYGGRATDAWWEREGPALCKLERVHVHRLDIEACRALAGLCARSMNYQCMVQEGEFCIGTGDGMLQLRPLRLS